MYSCIRILLMNILLFVGFSQIVYAENFVKYYQITAEIIKDYTSLIVDTIIVIDVDSKASTKFTLHKLAKIKSVTLDGHKTGFDFLINDPSPNSFINDGKRLTIEVAQNRGKTEDFI